LTEGEVSMIARRIFAEYKTQWTKAFGEAEVRTEKGEKALLRDAETLKAKLGKIEEFGGVGDEVLAVVKAKIGFVDEKADEESKSEAGKKEGEGVVEKGSGDGNGTATPAVEENSKSNGADAKV
jgi:vacuolar protein sorting-associated protein 54